jgi:hypothetical protein
MNTNTQLTKLRTRLGEPSDEDQARFTVDQLLDLLNEGRRHVARESRCFQVRDSQTLSVPASGVASLVSVSNDFIGLYRLEYNGRPLRPVRSANWRDVVGIDDTIRGTPSVFKYFARQFQLYQSVSQAGLVFRYEGWAYPADLVENGSDSDFNDDMAEAAIWRATVIGRDADDRDSSAAEKNAARTLNGLKAQYRPKGTRYVNTGELYIPPTGYVLV